MSAKIELKSQLFSVGHYLLKSTGADFRGNGKLNFSTESLILQNKNVIGNLKRDMLAVVEKKAHLNFAISITVKIEANDRNNRAEISNIFIRPLSTEIDRD